MLPQIFDYVSWYSYMALVVGLLVIGVAIYFSWCVIRERDPARVEKITRYVGLLMFFEMVVLVIVYFDWQSGHPLIWVDGVATLDVSPAINDWFFWIFVSLTPAYLAPLGIAMLMKRRRTDKAMDEELEMERVLHEEYGPDEAPRIMARAGHDKRFHEVRRDY